MINSGVDVPEKHIAIFPKNIYSANTIEDVEKIIEKPSVKRPWFTPDFYRCLPLTVANQYGFFIKATFDFEVHWNGGNETEDMQFSFDEESAKKNIENPLVLSHFGNGIVTIGLPFILRTPPGVNLMIISPPNVLMHNMTVMSGVIETDNLRRDFSINIKLHHPGIYTFNAHNVLATVMPVPRYFADSFNLELAENIFEEDIILEEIQANIDTLSHRENVEIYLKDRVGRLYFSGKDVYGNMFPDHQKP
jgi:hypothetical protein